MADDMNTGFGTSGDISGSDLGTTGDIGGTSDITSTEHGVQGRLNQYTRRVSDMAGHVGERVNERVHNMSDRFRDVDFNRSIESVRTFTCENPGQALLISCSLGLLVGMMIRRGH